MYVCKYVHICIYTLGAIWGCQPDELGQQRIQEGAQGHLLHPYKSGCGEGHRKASGREEQGLPRGTGDFLGNPYVPCKGVR